ncbi:MAG: hypothetical protein RLZ10_300 [Bacteroidota bacterium]|jgi:hypothetical protein
MNKLFLLTPLLFVSVVTFSQNFYDRSTVQTIEIFFGFTNWDSQLDAATTTDTYVIADSVRINGVSFDSVGVKYKGNSSYNANNNKNPLHIELDHIKGNQDYQGYTDIKLQNGYSDPSMIREVLSYAILEQYMDCPKANFANVYVNGTLRGMYSSAESINKKFNGEHYYLSNDSYFKCNPVGGAGPGSTINPDLKYINMDSSSYFNGYELKSTYGWNRLVDLINTLNNNFTNIESKLDVDRALWMLAFNNVLVNLDSYSGAFRQNYYLTWDLNDRFVPTVWDLNMSFGGFPGGTGSGPYTATSLDPMSNSTSTNHPLIVKMLSNPMYKRMYMAHLRTIVQENFASQAYLTMANDLRTTIDASVQSDPYKFYTYTQFQNSLTTDIPGGGPPGSTIPGLQNLMSGRTTYFSTNSNYNLVAPTISAFGASNITPAFGETIYLTATCSNESTVYLGYRSNHQLKFNRVQMFDDGAHGDGAAGDHVYGYQVTIVGAIFEYYIYAENSTAGLFSPQRAEHEYHTLSISLPYCNIGDVLINEIVASNGSSAYDSNGENDDWVELYNTTSSAIDLSGMYLSDDALNIMKWSFPIGTSIPANGYLLVWCDNDLGQSGLHTNFKLSSLGENLIFSNGATVYDQVTFGVQSTDVAFARCPDGGFTFELVNPTPEANNGCQASISELEETFQLKLFPNPFSEHLNIECGESSSVTVKISDLQGRIIYSNSIGFGLNQLNVSNWSNGFYYATFEKWNGQKLTVNLVK